jgi:NADPH:quinone reductase-like Zn-dependent oxidoreductase
MSYQHVIVTEFGGPEKLAVIEEFELPEPAAGEVRVKVLVAGTGFTDTIIREGQYIDVKDKPPFTLGYDWFGVVDKLGNKVTGLRKGDFVADLSVIGGYTQYLCVDAGRVIKAPKGLDPAEAVSMILSYTTAWQMLKRIREFKTGQKALVHAAGGAVGTALLELCKLKGLEVYATASAGKKALVEKYGATHIDYRNEDFVTRGIELSDGGFDVIFDTVGGSNWDRSYKALRRGGILIAFGALQVTTGEEKIPTLLLGFAKLMGFWKLIPDGKDSTFYNILGRRKKHPDEFKEDVTELFGFLKAGILHPTIADRLPLAQAAEAHRRIGNADVLGKIVLVCNEQEPRK